MKQLSNKYVGIELSNATMREEDLIPSFLGFLNAIVEECEIQGEVNAIEEEVTQLEREDGDYKEEYREQASWILNEDIWDLLQEIAPEFTYFGSHEGDGACYGFWTDDESLQDVLMATIDEFGYQPDFNEIRACCEYIINLLDVHQR